MDIEGTPVKSLKSIVLDLPPSCIEFCPAQPEYFVVGTYKLQKEEATSTGDAADSEGEGDDGETQHQGKQPQSRNGSLLLFSLKDENISHVQTVQYPSAILDLHFSPHRGQGGVAAVVSSTGTLSFFELASPPPSASPSKEEEKQDRTAALREIATHRPLGEDSGVLFLSCAWHSSVPGLLAVTTSAYEVHVLRVDEAWGVAKAMDGPVTTHALEAWTVAFAPSLTSYRDENDPNLSKSPQPLVIYSGGDDSKLLRASCVYDPSRLAAGGEALEASSPAVNFKGHEAGVTAILPLDLEMADGSSIVVTGSYDDRLRVYRTYSSAGGVMMQRPSIVAEENLGGGVWRLKLIRLEPSTSGSETSPAGTSSGRNRGGWRALILASCMHAGCRVVEVRGEAGDSGDVTVTVAVLARFEEHRSMNYGSDFQPGSEAGRGPLRCVSTSFYDRLLCFWHYSAAE